MALQGPGRLLAPYGSTGETDSERRRLAWLLVMVGAAGFFLALGSQGPTGALFRWA